MTMTSDHGTTTGSSRWQRVVGILGLGVVLWVGGQLYNVVSFDGFGPGPADGTPGENQQQRPEAGGGGGHVPGPPVGGH